MAQEFKLGNNLKRHAWRSHCFTGLINQLGARIPEELGCLANVDDAAGIHAHQPRTGCIGSNQVIGQNNTRKRPRRAVQWTIAFHRHDRVCDHKMNRNRGADVENALLNTVPVENVLGPAIPASRDDAEHVFHAQSDARPVMRFHFGHGHKKISLHRRLPQPEALHSGVAGPKIHRDQLVAVQIDESDSVVPKNWSVAALGEHELCVPLVARSFSHDYLFGSQSAKTFGSGCNQEWVGVDGAADEVIDQIGFEDDVLAAHVQRKQLEPRKKGLANPLRVGLLTKNSDSRASQAANFVVPRREKG